MFLNEKEEVVDALSKKDLATEIISLNCGSVSLPHDLVLELASSVSLDNLEVFSKVCKGTYSAAKKSFKQKINMLQMLAANTPEVQEALNYFNVSVHPNNLHEMKTVLKLNDLNDSAEITRQAKEFFGSPYKIMQSKIEEIKDELSCALYDKDSKILPLNICKLINLKVIYLDAIYIPKEIRNLRNLTTVNMQGNRSNQITPFPREIWQLTNLTQLKLRHIKGIELLPAEIGHLTNLSGLYLNFNNLESIPSEIGKLTNLIDLDLGGNRLESVPKEIGRLKNLTNFDLMDNCLKSLPSKIGQLKNLTNLNLMNNRLESLPSEILQLTNLIQLDLGGNRLETIPSEIGLLTNLIELGLGGNLLESLPSKIRQLTNLTKIDLSQNPLNAEEIQKIKNNLPQLTEVIFE